MSKNETKCVILLNEIALKQLLEYNKVLDYIEGFEDL